MSLGNDYSRMQFDVSPTALVADLCSKRFQVQSILDANPEKKKELRAIGILDTPLDAEVLKSIRSNGKTIKKYSLMQSGNDFYDMIASSSYKPPEEFYSSLRSKVGLLYDCPEESIPEVMDIIPSCKQLIKTEPVQAVLRDTVSYKNRIAKLWENNEKGISRYLSEVVGDANLESNGKTVIISVMPALYRNEKCYGEDRNRSILYYSLPKSRTTEEAKSQEAYTVAALTHTKVHETMLPYKMHMTKEQKDKFHAFIKFLTEKEIFHRLTGKSYVDINTYKEDGDLMAKVYPYWLGYLHRKDTKPATKIQADIDRDREAFLKLNPGSKKANRYAQYGFEKLSAGKIAEFFVGKRGMTPYEFAKIDFDNRDAVQFTPKEFREER